MSYEDEEAYSYSPYSEDEVINHSSSVDHEIVHGTTILLNVYLTRTDPAVYLRGIKHGNLIQAYIQHGMRADGQDLGTDELLGNLPLLH